ncbi:FAD-binding oxidoreductase [Aspergillus undulatus]|uniref:FAD-binding oxidoreductase n=1 Tax=Aspergillus undulatus TaxID=1810928 RepID=UPI003CCD51B8
MSANPDDIVLLLSELREALNCEILTPISEGYGQSILRWTDAVSNAPAIIVLPTSAEEVAATVLGCVKRNVSFAVACGKHTTSDASSSYGGLVIDLDRMRNVTVHSDSKIVRVGGGCRAKDVNDALEGYDLAIVQGIVDDTGIGGLTLGGGYGWLSPRHGLMIDNLVAATVVLADGSITLASEHVNQDLFWAIRGAGQCFGVVVEFVFVAHELKNPVWAGVLGFTLDHLEAVFEFANNLIETTDGDSAIVIQLSRYPFVNSGRDLGIMAMVFHNGDGETAKSIFKPLLDLGPLVDTTKEQSYASLCSMLTPNAKCGGRNFSKGAAYTTPLRPSFLRENIVPQLDEMHLNVAGSDRSIIEFEFYKPDKWCEVPVTATAHGHRGRVQNTMIMLYWNEQMEDVRMERWSRDMASLVVTERRNNGRPAEGPVTEYGNYDHLSADPKQVFGVNYARLVELKKRYDPNNVFNKWYSLVE